jgi:hypothetical protein
LPARVRSRRFAPESKTNILVCYIHDSPGDFAAVRPTASLRHVRGFPALGLLRRLRPSTETSPGLAAYLGRALCPFVGQEHDAARREPARLELLGELRHDVPPPRRNGPLDGPREGVFDGRFLWPKRDQLTRTYVNSRRVELTRVDVNRRESHTLHGFDSRQLHYDRLVFGWIAVPIKLPST